MYSRLRVYNKLLLILPIAGYTILAAFNAYGLIDWMLACPVKAHLGFECLGCGSNRALIKILQGDFLAAWSYNPLIYLWVIIILTIIFREYRKYLRTSHE